MSKLLRGGGGYRKLWTMSKVLHLFFFKPSPCPRFIILPDQVEFIPGIPVTGDLSINELNVTSRLSSLEKNHDIVMKTLNDIHQ